MQLRGLSLRRDREIERSRKGGYRLTAIADLIKLTASKTERIVQGRFGRLLDVNQVD